MGFHLILAEDRRGGSAREGERHRKGSGDDEEQAAAMSRS